MPAPREKAAARYAAFPPSAMDIFETLFRADFAAALRCLFFEGQRDIAFLEARHAFRRVFCRRRSSRGFRWLAFRCLSFRQLTTFRRLFAARFFHHAAPAVF